MKNNKLLPITLLCAGLIPAYVGASSPTDNHNKDFHPGTYALEFSINCTQTPTSGIPNSVEVISTGEFTLDGDGNFISNADYVYLGSDSNMGQAKDYCTGAYVIQNNGTNTVIQIPEMQCAGKFTQGSLGGMAEPVPPFSSNFEVWVRGVSLTFQPFSSEGVYSDVPAFDTPVDVEQFVLTDAPEFSFSRRCYRMGSFYRTGPFKRLSPPSLR